MISGRRKRKEAFLKGALASIVLDYYNNAMEVILFCFRGKHDIMISGPSKPACEGQARS